MRRSSIAAPGVGAALALLTTFAHADVETIKFATLAPKNSSWGKVVSVWQKVISTKTNGRMELEVFFNAVQGDEPALVSKMRTGQLDGAALSATGLSLINRNVLVLQLPGVVNSWPLLDMVRGLLGKRLEAEFKAKDFILLGWGDIGLVHQMSRGYAIRGPNDLKGKRPVVWRNEPIGPMMYSLIGGIVPVPMSTTEILPNLRSGAVDSVAAPSLAAEQLQWTPYLDHIGDRPVVTAVGATVLRAKRFDALPADLKSIFLDLQTRALQVNRNKIRQLDAEAYQRLVRKMQVVTPTTDDNIAWYRVFLKSVDRMRNGVFPRDLLDAVLRATGKG